MKNRRSDDMIDRIKAFNEFHIKKGASANAPFLKLQRSNYTLIRERECAGCWGRTRVEHRQLRHELKSKAVFRP